MQAVRDKAEIPVPTAQQGSPLLKVLSSFLHERLDKTGLAVIAELPGLVAYRVTCPPGSMCFIPSGSVFSERTLNGGITSGWRCSIVQDKPAINTLEYLMNQGHFGEKSAQVLGRVMKEVSAGSVSGNAAVAKATNGAAQVPQSTLAEKPAVPVGAGAVPSAAPVAPAPVGPSATTTAGEADAARTPEVPKQGADEKPKAQTAQSGKRGNQAVSSAPAKRAKK